MADGVAEDVLVVCPAERGARDSAAERLEAALETFRGAGLRVRGEIGTGDPLQALQDAFRGFPADAIIISTLPVGSSKWLEQGVVEAARASFDVPVTHVVGDASASELPTGSARADPA